ncbi:hypothetical protein E1B28_004815 [Marasmius oreades]|uniref:Uncharacterized protein n=1 Tax=Marasmius oreades TaxID=181124 RepID=A0A9P7UZG2_9AGAR|nr:uncharacterized protein E1B28_004815 [Marasmius oreades]KAG7097472.1 hypothetical protein E1B28_004815 [Marasmius oreades]
MAPKLAPPVIPLPPARSNPSRPNRNINPAAIIKPAPRRTHEEVLAEKARKAADKQVQARRRNAGLQKAAEIEVVVDLKDANNLDHPVPLTLEKKKRPQVDIPAGDPDEYNPDAVVDEEDLDDSGDEIGVAKSKNLKGKGGQRAALMLEKKKVAAAALSNTHTVRAPGTRPNLKRALPPLPPLPLPLSKKAKHIPPKSALRSTWLEDSAVPVLAENDEADSFESPSGTVYQRLPSIMSGTGSFLSGYRSGAATSEGGTSTRAPSETGNMIMMDSEGGIINAGGVSSDEDGGPMEILNDHLTIQESSPMLKSKVKNMAKVNVVTVPPTVHVRRARAVSGFEINFGIKRDKITVKHLDRNLHELFAKIYTPYIRQMAGIGLTSPWDNPSETDLITIWNSFSSKAGNPGLSDFQREVILKLINDRLVEWRNSFAATAIVTLDAILSALPLHWEPELSNTDCRSAYVQWLGQGEENERNFYYREITLDESHEDDQLLKKGIFQSQLMLATLASHLAAISSLRDTLYVETKLPPKGALVLSIQACKHALAIFDTGIKVVPTGIAGHFSKANWMDQDHYVDGGRVVKDRRTVELIV